MIKAMPVNFTMSEGDLVILISVSLALVTFIIYWFTAQSGRIKEWFDKNDGHDAASVKHFLFSKAAGFILMGVIPLVTCLVLFPQSTPASYGIDFRSDTLSLTIISIIALSLIVIPVALISARKAENLVNYPQIRANTWTRWTILATIGGWALYLLGYEVLFRGVLLMPLAVHLGVWPAIIVNISFYSATHIPKGLSEAVGAIPLGLIFCILTLMTGTIWIAFFVHLAMAITNCLTAFRFHPGMQYKKG